MAASSLLPTFFIERDLIKKGYRIIAGVDEAGRGALAGPLALGLVIYDCSFVQSSQPEFSAINDSKKLSPGQRLRALDLIQKHASIAAWTFVSHKIVDRLNVNRATEFALNKMLGRIPLKPDIVMLDGNFSFQCGIPVMPIKKGDSLSLSIASASIVAKVNRDLIMEKLDQVYPGYGLAKNKGYGTERHIEAIKRIGYSPIHRMSYDPVKSMAYSRKHEN